MSATAEKLRRFQACLAEGGLVEGAHYINVWIDDEGDVTISRWPSQCVPQIDRLVWKALVLCDGCTLTFEEWQAL